MNVVAGAASGLFLLVAGCVVSGSGSDEGTGTPEPQAVVWLAMEQVLVKGPVREMAGPEHCGWERAVFLEYRADDQALFLRDQDGVTRSWAGELDGLVLDATLPADAVDTGYREGARELWVSTDLAFAYIVAGDGVERWPRIPEEWRRCY